MISYNFLNKETIDLFELFRYEIFHFEIDDICLKDLLDEIEEIDNNYVSEGVYEKKLKKLRSFNSSLQSIISKLDLPTNKYIQKFDIQNIKINFSISEGSYEELDKQVTQNKYKYKFNLPQININIEQKKVEGWISIPKPQSFFNEAKLTAIALSVRLAITQTKLKNSPSKLLVLDDLLVSLDMSNRDSFLDILLSDTTLKKYQKIILTHDKAFFEMAKQKFNYREKDKWKYFEMYVDSEGDIEKPFIKTNEPYHEKAIEYFEKREYEIASNFLRKEVEKQLYEYLGLKTLEGMIDTAKIKDNYTKLDNCFAPLIIALKGFDKCENIPDNIKVEKCIAFANKVKKALISLENIFKENSFHDINGIKDRILNPQSHYNITMPLYKKELEDAIRLLEAFDSILNGDD